MSGDITPNDWQELEALIDQVLDSPPERRAALIAELSGGNEAKRAELERLVLECEQAYPLLDRPVAERFATLLDDHVTRIPDVLAERYRVVRELGRGGMAVVYLARDMKHERDVAVKIVRPEVAASLGRQRFLREIAIAAKLKHPHIVHLFDSGEVDTLLYYVMPYEEGDSLRARLTREGRLPVADTVSILCDVCDALAYAHQQGVIHRDIKPENVLLSGRHAMVADFGIARAFTEASESTTFITGGALLGTPAYMAPEQATSSVPVDHRVDIYAVGVMAYEMLAGQRPFSGDTPPAQREIRAETATIDLTRLRQDVPPMLASVVMTCLEQSAADRWKSVDDLLAALKKTTIGTGSENGRDAGLWARRLWPRLAIALLAVVAFGAAALFLTPRRSSRTPRAEELLSSLSIGILPVRDASRSGVLQWLSGGLESRLSMELTGIPGLVVSPPTETIAALMSRGWTLDSIAMARKVDYFVRPTISDGARDTAVASLELIEGGVRSVRVGDVRELLPTENALAVFGRRVAEHLRPMLGTRVRERQLEAGASNALALEHRRRADHHRLMARAGIDKSDLSGAQRHLDSASSLLIESQRLDRRWFAPRLARASLSELGASVVLRKPGAPDHAAIRRVFDRGIVVLDSVISSAPNDAVALALRGRLRLQRTLFGVPPELAAPALDSAERDLRSAIKLDSMLSRPAADLSQLLYSQARYPEAADYAERAYRLDAYMEGAGTIISRLALSNFELNKDAEAARWCAEGIRREPANPAHFACDLDVMAWGTNRADPDSAWARYDQLSRVMARGNVSLIAYSSASVAAVLAKAPGVRPESTKAVLKRMRVAVATSSDTTQALRERLTAYEAAVLFRLGETARANELFALYRRRNPQQAEVLAQRRMLRGFVKPSMAPPDSR